MRIRWRNFELPSKVTPDPETHTAEYGRFLIEPFERGFGHTIGNGLRRNLSMAALTPTVTTSQHGPSRFIQEVSCWPSGGAA